MPALRSANSGQFHLGDAIAEGDAARVKQHCASTPSAAARRRCPRAASGHAAAAPPSSVMSERRFTAGSFRAFDRKVSTPQLRHETAALRDFDRAFVRFGAVATFIRSPPRAQASTVTGEAEHRRSFALHRTIACVIFVCVSSPLQLTISERWYSLRHVRR
jgi:hypothetical protein